MNLADIQAAVGIHTPIRHQLFIDGRFVDAESGETLATLNPHDNSTIADVALADALRWASVCGYGRARRSRTTALSSMAGRRSTKRC